MKAACSFISLLFLVSFTFSQVHFVVPKKSQGKIVEYVGTKVDLRFAKGNECKFGAERPDRCRDYWEAEVSDIEILNGNYLLYNFTTTVNQCPETHDAPLHVAGEITDFYLANTTVGKIDFGAGLTHFKPTWKVEYIEGYAERWKRLYMLEERGRRLNFEWLELKVYGEYRPEMANSWEKKKEKDRRRELRAQTENPQHFIL